ncbi:MULTISPECIES: TlpA family protein disulfide reductase [Actinoalloteichus]|uniref:Thiol-disulfide isomerase-like thioredoxin n=1 Tax=Actinoalloteichus fjordicus TaxID=1612552 RepID=A0AAC9L701_9PSEU|nr:MULTISPECIES: TlpA disulfide reductase family protein [Actinoalloteichus]APU12343.1 thiol-disulfide isomerase-like thioredoxin [Actinoalloteichus fjordicus]APU18295.1 thiol-disulfide isomerase-like thioredoxin [Actinoalloteichus sp. GBA129-24]
MNANIRWSILVLALAVAGVVALWPRDEGFGPAANPDRQAQDAGGSADQFDQEPPTAVRAADLSGIEVTDLADGTTQDLGELVAEGPVLLNVWATWCAPCLEELPVLAEYAQEPDAIPVLGIQRSSDLDAGRDLLAELGAELPSVHDANDLAIRALRAPVMPANYVVDEAGAIHPVHPPAPFEDTEQARQAVARYLEQS